MKKRIIDLVNQLSENEQKDLYTHIKRQYAVEDKAMLRDDIFDKIKTGLQSEYDWIEEPLIEETSFKKLELDAVQITDFSIFMIDSFNIPEPDFRKIMEWSSIKDMVDYVENNTESEPYISGFELEA